MLFARKPLLLYLAVLLFLQITVCLASWQFVKTGQVDFRNFYADGYIVRTGQSKSLYDYDAQVRLQNQTVTPRTAALPLMVPPCVALAFVPLSLLTYLHAFIAFALINLLLAAVSIACIRFCSPRLEDYAPFTTALLVLSFPPLGFALAQGQLSIVLLAVYCATFVMLQRRQHPLAGLLFSLALIKLQIALPVALLFLFWKQWRFVAGFLGGVLVLIAVSIQTVGQNHVRDLWRSMFSTPAILPDAAAQMKYGISPDRMTNLYGLSYRLFGGGRLSLSVTVISSVLLLVWAARRRPSFPLAMLVGLLVSYHLYLHDLTLFLIPYALLLGEYLSRYSGSSESVPPPLRPRKGGRELLSAGALATYLLVFPLTFLLIASSWVSLLAVPGILAAFALGEPKTRRNQPVE